MTVSELKAFLADLGPEYDHDEVVFVDRLLTSVRLDSVTVDFPAEGGSRVELTTFEDGYFVAEEN